MRVATAYTGWKKESNERYATVNKVAYASFGSVEKFTDTFEAILEHRFDMAAVEYRISNGDGEAWIKTETEKIDSILQLDPYHRSRAIVKSVLGKAEKKRVFAALKSNDVYTVLDELYKIMDKEKDYKRKVEINKLYEYFWNNKTHFLTWKERGIKLPKPPAGIEYRNLGTQESANHAIITRRMKHRKGSWTENGGNNMSNILCYINTIGLDSILTPVLNLVKKKDNEKDCLSAAKAPKKDGKGYDADWLNVDFSQYLNTSGRNAMKTILAK